MKKTKKELKDIKPNAAGKPQEQRKEASDESTQDMQEEPQVEAPEPGSMAWLFAPPYPEFGEPYHTSERFIDDLVTLDMAGKLTEEDWEATKVPHMKFIEAAEAAEDLDGYIELAVALDEKFRQILGPDRWPVGDDDEDDVNSNESDVTDDDKHVDGETTDPPKEKENDE